MKHEWYFNNVQNASADIITIPDTGSVGGLDLSNPALANKPTQSSIGTKISYAADGVDDYLYKATTNFMKSMPTWMVTVVFKYDSSGDGINQLLAASNESNTKPEGWLLYVNPTAIVIEDWNAAGTQGGINRPFTFVNGQDYIITLAYNGTQSIFYAETTQVGIGTITNPISRPSQTDNVTTFARIRPAFGNFFRRGNIGYIGVDEFNLTRLNNNVATLKSTFGI